MSCHVSHRKLDPELKCQYQTIIGFGPGTKAVFKELDDKKWCPFHLPIKNLKGEASEKMNWNENQKNEFYAGLKKVIDRYIENKNTIDLSYTVFPNGFAISDLINEFFGHDFTVNLHGCELHSEINKKNVKIEKFDFTNAVFYKSVLLENCDLQDTLFINTLFHETSSFACSFIKGCKFDSSEFIQAANFSGCQISCSKESREKSTFDKITFHHDAFFIGSIFENPFSIINVNFNELADFSAQNTLSLPSDEFNEMNFQNCEFQTAKFINRKFKSKTDFSSCIFNEAPQFYGCTFHQHTIFPSQKDFKGLFKKEAAPAFRVLYRAMAELKNRGYESMFYALVQKSERKSKTQPWPIRLASLLYELISNYGQSIGRPLLSLLIVTTAFSSLYTYFASPIINWHAPIDWNLIGNSFDLSIKQIIKPFSLYAKQTPTGELIKNSYPIVFMSAAISQSIISLALIALFLLALRWNFKKD